MSNTKKKATVHVHCTCMHLIIISELSEVNLFGLGIQKVLLELLFCFVFFFISRQHQIERCNRIQIFLQLIVWLLLLLPNSAGCLAMETILLLLLFLLFNFFKIFYKNWL